MKNETALILVIAILILVISFFSIAAGFFLLATTVFHTSLTEDHVLKGGLFWLTVGYLFYVMIISPLVAFLKKEEKETSK